MAEGQSHVVGSSHPVADLSYVDIRFTLDPMYPYAGLWADGWGGAPAVPTAIVAVFSPSFEDGFADDGNPRYDDTDVPGRAEMYKTFMGTDNKQIPLSLEFLAEVEGDGNYADPVEYSPEWVMKVGRTFGQMRQPVFDPDSGIGHAPPPWIFKLGDLVLARVVVDQVAIKWLGPFSPGTMQPHGVAVDLQLSVVRYPAGTDVSAVPGRDGVPAYNQFLVFRDVG